MSDMFDGGVVAGRTSRSIRFKLNKTSDGTEQTGKAAADMTAYYWRIGGSPTSISLSDLAAITTAWSSGGVKEADATNQPGVYRLDIPDAAIASGADWVVITVKVTACFLAEVWLPIVTNNSADIYSRLGAPAGASVSADIAEIEGETDSIIATLGTPAGASVSADIAEIEAETDAIGTPAGASIAADIAAVKADTGPTLTDATAIKAKTDNLPSAILKMTAQHFPFYLSRSDNVLNPDTGDTVTVNISKDEAAFAAAAGAVTEIGNGWYYIAFTSADTNADRLAMRITAPNAATANIVLFTKPS